MEMVIPFLFVGIIISVSEVEKMIDYAKSELARIEHDEEGMQDEMDKCILQLLEVLEKQGHTNHTIHYCLRLFERLANFKPLTPLTGDDDEWKETAKNIFQNKRCSSVFKNGKDGKAYDIDGRMFSNDGGNTWYMNANSRVYIDFPYIVPDEPEKVYLKRERMEDEVMGND